MVSLGFFILPLHRCVRVCVRVCVHVRVAAPKAFYFCFWFRRRCVCVCVCACRRSRSIFAIIFVDLSDVFCRDQPHPQKTAAGADIGATTPTFAAIIDDIIASTSSIPPSCRINLGMCGSSTSRMMFWAHGRPQCLKTTATFRHIGPSLTTSSR